MSANAKYLDETGLAHFWDKIKDHISDSVANGTSNLTNRIHFVVPDQKSSTATLTATVSSITALTPGLVIALRMPFANSTNTTLNINSLGAKPIYYQSSTRTAGIFPSGAVILLVYEETSIATGCFKAIYSYDKDTDTHKTTHLYVGASGATANAATTTNTTTFLTVADDTTASNSIQITGSGGASVTAAAGVITIDVPEVSSITNAQIDAMFA